MLKVKKKKRNKYEIQRNSNFFENQLILQHHSNQSDIIIR